THYADAPAPGEFAEFARANGFTDEADWPEVEAWDAHPDIAFVLRRRDGTPLLFNHLTRVSRLPEFGRISTSLREAARTSGIDPERSFAGICLYADAPAEDLAEAGRLASGAFMHRSGMPELQAILMHFPEPNRNPMPSEVLGFEVRDGDA